MDLVGFDNFGNTCYINSVLQCFIYDPFFRSLNFLDVSDIRPFIQKFFNENTSFKRFQQNDAHEFLMCFLELLVKHTPGVPTPGPSLWNTFLKENGYSKCINKYYGQSKKTIKCVCCKNVSTTFDHYNTINLNVPNKSIDTTSLFINYLKKEIHNDPDNLYYCEACKSNQITEQKITLTIVPDTLIIVLKRYSASSKVYSNVKYDPELNIRIDSDIKKYYLKSIVNHSGRLYDGHYTAHVNKDKWYYIDDSVISKDVSFTFTNNDAYILFYSVIQC